LLREALDQVGEIAGRVSPDDVIGRIFATFCIGK
jgi:tRNA modification GTPase